MKNTKNNRQGNGNFYDNDLQIGFGTSKHIALLAL